MAGAAVDDDTRAVTSDTPEAAAVTRDGEEGLVVDPDMALWGCVAAGLAWAGSDAADEPSSCRRHWGNAANCGEAEAGAFAAAFAGEDNTGDATAVFAGEAGAGEGTAAFAGSSGGDTAAAAPFPPVPLAPGTAMVEAFPPLAGTAGTGGPGLGDTARNLRRHSGMSGDVTWLGAGAGAAEGCCAGDRGSATRKGS